MTSSDFNAKHPRQDAGKFAVKKAGDPGTDIIGTAKPAMFVTVAFTNSDGRMTNRTMFDAADILAGLTPAEWSSLQTGGYDLYADALERGLLDLPNDEHDFQVTVSYTDGDLEDWRTATTPAGSFPVEAETLLNDAHDDAVTYLNGPRGIDTGWQVVDLIGRLDEALEEDGRMYDRFADLRGQEAQLAARTRTGEFQAAEGEALLEKYVARYEHLTEPSPAQAAAKHLAYVTDQTQILVRHLLDPDAIPTTRDAVWAHADEVTNRLGDTMDTEGREQLWHAIVNHANPTWAVGLSERYRLMREQPEA